MTSFYTWIGALAGRGLLPSDFQYPFLIRGFLCVLVLSPILGGLSHLVVTRRMAFFSAALGQQDGFAHAGAITSILDSACGYAALSVAREGAEVLSVEFKVNLLAPAVGETFIARASVKRSGKTLCVCTGDAIAVNGGEEKLIATMLATMIYMQIK